MGGWGLKNILLFSKDLAAKGWWRLLKTESLWTQVVTQKYLALDSVEDLVRAPEKSRVGGSVIWEAVVNSFSMIESNLAWNIGDGRRLRIGEDPWIGSAHRHLLPKWMVAALRERGIIFLSELESPRDR